MTECSAEHLRKDIIERDFSCLTSKIKEVLKASGEEARKSQPEANRSDCEKNKNGGASSPKVSKA